MYQNVLTTNCNLHKGYLFVSSLGVYINLSAIVVSLARPCSIKVLIKTRITEPIKTFERKKHMLLQELKCREILELFGILTLQKFCKLCSNGYSKNMYACIADLVQI